jgi:methylated-DNA-[protein]-cysteine S-methyltransferase
MRPIHYSEFTTPIGVMQVGITDKGIAMFEYPIETRIVQHKKKLEEHFSEVSEAPMDVLQELAKQMEEYFDGNRQSFDLPLDLIGTDFQCEVWQELLKIPFGKTISYLELAERINNVEGIRAVASANGQNRIPILVPCHRVIASDGKLTGYSGGLTRKSTLLSLETGQSRLIF